MEKNECVDGLKNLISQNLFMSLIPISNENFVYEERVQLNCFYTVQGITQSGLVLLKFRQ